MFSTSRAWGCFSLISGLMRVALWWGEKSHPRSVLSLLELFNIAPPLEAGGRFLQRSMPGCHLPALAGCLCATLSLLHPAVYCVRSPFSTFPSPWYQASHSWGARLGHPHSVLGPLSAIHYCTPSQSGWQICSARCPDPALPSPVAGNALATSRVPCPHTVSYMCYVLHVILRLAHTLVAPHWSWGRFICT